MGGWNGSIQQARSLTRNKDDATMTGDKIVIYVKGYEKREWLLDEARQEIYVENIEAHYKNIKSLSKFDVISYAYFTLSETVII